MNIEIENIPAPTASRTTRDHWIAKTIRSLGVDQSFFVAAKDIERNPNFRMQCHGVARRIGIKVSVRKDEKDGVGGTRIYRTE